MFAKERRFRILNILLDKKEVKVKELSEQFEVSEVIIRKDLKLLEDEGKLERTHGGAIIRNDIPHFPSLDQRKIAHIKGKKTIANKLYKEIKENDVLFLDETTINLILAEQIKKKPKNITVITNMLEILTCLQKTVEVELIGIGGVYHKTEGSFMGDLALDAILKLNTNKLFMGAAGIDMERNLLSVFYPSESALKKAMMQMTAKVYYVGEKEKFFSKGPYNFAKIEELDMIVTDWDLTAEYLDILKEKNVKII